MSLVCLFLLCERAEGFSEFGVVGHITTTITTTTTLTTTTTTTTTVLLMGMCGVVNISLSFGT
jgi:hypothetical protein